MISRRQFLRGAVPIVAGGALLAEEMTRRIFLPPRGGWVWRDVSEPIVNQSLTSNTAWFLSRLTQGDLAWRRNSATVELQCWDGARWVPLQTEGGDIIYSMQA